MEVQRKCQWCGKPFIAHTMVTRFCSKSCTEKAYKDKKRKQKLQEYEARQSEQPMQEVGIVGGKPFLSPAEAATLLGISRATIYRHMAAGIIRALQLRGRTIIRKSDIEKMFDNAPDYKKRSYGRKQTVLYYTTNEILEKYQIQKKTLYRRCKLYNIPKVEEGSRVFYNRTLIDKYFADLAEEVIRMYGYEHIESTFLKNASVTDGGYSDGQKRELRVKNLLRTQGYSETVNYSFISPKDYAMLKISEQTQRAIKIKNPIGEDMSLMRTTLAPSLVNTVVRNLRRGNTAGRLFELASVYRAESLPLTEMAKEDKTLCTAVFGEKETFFTAKGVFELIASEFGLKFDYAPADIAYLHPGKSAEILVNGKAVGYLGELAPDVAESLVVETNVYVGELDYAALSELLGGAIKYRQLPKFPEVQRDLALVAEEKLTCAEIEKVIFEASKYVTSVKLFDVYRGAQVGEGKKSMAFSLTLTPADKAIKPEDADAQIKRILRALSEKLSVELR